MTITSSLDLISYAFSHHLFEQAVPLSKFLQSYMMVTPSYASSNLVKTVSHINKNLGQILAKRNHPDLESSFAKTYPIEHLYQLLAKLKRQPFSYFHAHDRMATRIIRDFLPPKALIAIDTGAESLFRAWKGKTFCILDLTIAIPQYRVHIYDQARRKSWNQFVHFHYPCDWELDRYKAEIDMADLILCPSQFVFDSCLFSGIEANRLRVLPYGFNPGIFRAATRNSFRKNNFKIAFVGSFCYRKGSHILLEAFCKLSNRFNDVELHIFGKIIDKPSFSSSQIIFHGHVPQSTLATELVTMDVLAFPTFFEGSAYSVYQALACGLPVVTTANCGSVVNESCGMILDEVSPIALYAALEKLYCDRDQLYSMSLAATEVVKHYSWQTYGTKLIQILRDVIPDLLS